MEGKEKEREEKVCFLVGVALSWFWLLVISVFSFWTKREKEKRGGGIGGERRTQGHNDEGKNGLQRENGE